ncbi:hypothetical protein LSAT2_021566 [Lamellibrachia satsuma]|nr:hypothetical protein LSAT2_021566 [Lamellibrachia satsuma]
MGRWWGTMVGCDGAMVGCDGAMARCDSTQRYDGATQLGERDASLDGVKGQPAGDIQRESPSTGLSQRKETGNICSSEAAFTQKSSKSGACVICGVTRLPLLDEGPFTSLPGQSVFGQLFPLNATGPIVAVSPSEVHCSPVRCTAPQRGALLPSKVHCSPTRCTAPQQGALLPNESVDEILDRLRPMIAEHFDVDDEQVLWGTDLLRDFGVDRLCVTEFLLKIEEEFGICVPDKETTNLTKISAIVQYIAFHVA